MRHWLRFHQLPEPWVGRLERARILFVSSNPSIGGSVPEDPEAAPDRPHLVTRLRPDEAIVERQSNAFSHYMEDGTREIGAGVTHYWAAIKQRALELLPAVIPGDDYAITEVVRCKSKDEAGVPQARDFCSDLYLRRTLELSAARVIVGVGAQARRVLPRFVGVTETTGLQRGHVSGRDVAVVFLAHPAGFQGPKMFASALSAEELAELRALVAP